MSGSPRGATPLPGQGRWASSPAGPFGEAIRRDAGRGLLELLVAISLLIVIAAAAIPRAQSMVHEYRLRGAAFHLRGLFRQARSTAASRARHVGIVFDEVEGNPVFSIHIDGNGNGIRRMEAQRGVDPSLRAPYRLSDTFPGVRFGSLPTDAASPFLRGIQIGRSHIVSFSPLGASTTGTLYLTNQYGLVYAVVIFGATGRVRVARYQGGGRWQAM